MDWFHSLVDAPTYRIVLVLMATYIFLILFFAILYYELYQTYGCQLELTTFNKAFIFSIETFATIGYGAPISIFYGDCRLFTAILTAQCCVRLIIEAISIGILYSRLARPGTRASTIIFSDKGVIRRIRGKLYFMFQLCELRKHQLVEAHIRLYVVKREVDPSFHIQNAAYGQSDVNQRVVNNRVAKPYVFVQTCTMRLNHPNDELGGMLLLMVPQVVVHEVDLASPLMPPPLWISAATGEVIRWNPPAYRNLRKPRTGDSSFIHQSSNANVSAGQDQSRPHSPTGQEDDEDIDEYRANMPKKE
jgi:hypothetical protein